MSASPVEPTMSGIGDKETAEPVAAGPPPLGPIAGVLGTLPKIKAIIESLDRSALTELEASFEWYGISGGTILFQAGEVADDAFVLVAGRLGVYPHAGFGSRLTAQIGPGELVGEMALISGEPRSATVIALRDSEVVRIPRQAVEQLMGSSPQLMLYVVRLLVDRLRRSQRPPLPQATKALAFIPVDDQPLAQDFADRIQTGFSSLSVRVGLIGSVSSHLSADAIAAIEEQHDLVLYLGDRRCWPGAAAACDKRTTSCSWPMPITSPTRTLTGRSATCGGFIARPTSCSSIRPRRSSPMERVAGSAASRLIEFSTRDEGIAPTMQEWRG
jgi:CRP-like cAMP-binding protein